MTFIEQRFPDDISYGSLCGPEFSTDVIVTHNGFEKRNINWPEGRGKYNAGHGVKTKEQLGELITFFRICNGKALGFRFKDWTDYTGADQIIGTGDGTIKKFQLIKTYSVGTNSYVRQIKKPVSDTIIIKLGNAPVNSSAFQINYQTGLVTFKTAPAVGIKISASYEFDTPVRFDTDLLAASIDNFDSYSWQNIHLVEIRI